MDKAAPAASRGKILVIEDDPSAARFAVYVLGERGGFDVTHVSDPVVAIDRIEDEPWDMMLADLDLPRLSGLDVLACARRVAPGLPVVLTTARAMIAPDTHALASHADAFLEKPIRPQRLIVVAATLIRTGVARTPAAPPQPTEGRHDLP